MLREMITLLIERRDFFLGLLGEHLGISLTAILIAVLLGGLVGSVLVAPAAERVSAAFS